MDGGKPLPGVKGEAGGLSVDNYTVKGDHVDRTAEIPAGLARHVLSGTRGEKRFDRTTPIEQRRYADGSLYRPPKGKR